jgi:hypothetical protein
MSGSMSDAPAPAPVPSLNARELVRAHVEDRRKGLHQHRPEAVRIAADVLSAMGARANGGTPSLRADRDVRHRLYQFSGEKGLPIEDLVAIGLENDLGIEVLLTGLRVLAHEFGHVITSADAQPVEALEELSAASEDLVARARRVLAATQAVVAPRVALYRKSRA